MEIAVLVHLRHCPEREEEKENRQYVTKKFQNQKCLEFKDRKNLKIV
jgi:hypothetical protein